MKINVREFKKVNGDESHAVLKHPDGHEIKINIKALTPKARGELASMPKHLDVGGRPTDDYTPPPEQAPNPNLPPDFNNQVSDEARRLAVNSGMPGLTLNPMEQAPPQSVLDQFKTKAETNVAEMFQKNKQHENDVSELSYEKNLADVQNQNAIRAKSNLPLLPLPQKPVGLDTSPDPMSYSMPKSGNDSGVQQIGYGQPQGDDPYGYGVEASQYMKGLGEAKRGIYGQADIAAKQGQQEEQALNAQIDEQRNLQGDFNNQFQDINNEREALQKDFANQHINPNQFWEDKSVPSKISTAIGLILGGIGGGLTGQENPALKFLQNNIDRDITSQRLNVDNKLSLLNINRQRFQDEVTAVNISRVMKNDMVSNQLKAAAARAMGPMEKQRALQAAGQLDMQSAGIVQQMALRKTMLNGIENPNLSPATKIQFMTQSGLIKPEQQTQAFKELGEFQIIENLRKDLHESFNDLNGKFMHGLLSPRDRQSAMEAFAGRLATIGDKRFNLEASAQQAHAVLPQIGDSVSTIQNKRRRLDQLVDSLVSTPVLDGIGIRLPRRAPKNEGPPNLAGPQPRQIPVVGSPMNRKPNG